MRYKKSRVAFDAVSPHRVSGGAERHTVSDAARAASGLVQRKGAQGVRNRRLAMLVREALGEVFARPEVLRAPLLEQARLTVTEVDLSPDLSLARVKLLPLAASLGDAWDAKTIAALEAELAEATPRVRKALSERVELKRTPRLDLRYDRHRLEAQDMEAKLAQRSLARSQETACQDADKNTDENTGEGTSEGAGEGISEGASKGISEGAGEDSR